MKFATFDLEIAKEFPDGGDWRASAPLGITCAALGLTDAAEPRFFHSAPQLSRPACIELVHELMRVVEDGYTLVTWNGTSFDFAVLAQEVDAAACGTYPRSPLRTTRDTRAPSLCLRSRGPVLERISHLSCTGQLKRRVFLALILALAVTACTATQNPPRAPVFQIVDIKPDKTDANLSVSLAGDTAWIDVNSASGIGSARIVITAGDVPDKIFLRVHLKGLELLKFTFESTPIQMSLPSGGDPAPAESVRQENSKGELLSPDGENWMPVEIVGSSRTIPLRDGYFQIELPRAFYASGSREFSIQWIDFYR